MGKTENSGLSIRLPLSAEKILKDVVEGLSESSGEATPNRLVKGMTMESLRLIEALDVGGEAELPLLFGFRSQLELRPLFAALAKINLQKMTRAEACLMNIPFTSTNREKVKQLAGNLQWSLAQTVAECLHVFAVLASAEKELDEMPTSLINGRALQIYRDTPPVLHPDEGTFMNRDLGRLNARIFRPGLVSSSRAVPMEVLVDLL